MTPVDDLLAAHCIDGVAFKTIGSVAEVLSGATPSKSNSAYWDDGTIPWLSSGEVNKGTIYEAGTRITQAGYDSCSTKMVPARTVVMALAGQGKTRGMVARTRLECCTNQSLASIVPGAQIDSDFLYHFLKTQYQRLRDVSSGDGARGGLNLSMIREFRIPVPPLPVQREIVATLDDFEGLTTRLEAELEAELGLRSRQHAFYREQALGLTYSAPTALIREVVDFSNAKAHEKLVDPTGTVALMTARFISRGVANRFVRTEDVLTPAYEGDVALVMSDLPNGKALAKTFYVDADERYAANQRVCLLRPRDTSLLLPRFLHYVMDRNPQLLAYNNGMDQTHLKKDHILDVRVPVPPMEAQERVVAILDTLGAHAKELAVDLDAEIAARRKQYEYCRDKLLTFAEAA